MITWVFHHFGFLGKVPLKFINYFLFLKSPHIKTTSELFILAPFPANQSILNSLRMCHIYTIHFNLNENKDGWLKIRIGQWKRNLKLLRTVMVSSIICKVKYCVGLGCCSTLKLPKVINWSVSHNHSHQDPFMTDRALWMNVIIWDSNHNQKRHSWIKYMENTFYFCFNIISFFRMHEANRQQTSWLVIFDEPGDGKDSCWGNKFEIF